MTKILVILSLLLLSACATTGTSTSAPAATPKYELTLNGNLDGQDFQGIAIGSDAADHSVTVTSANKVNYFIAQSCHRSEKHEDVITQGWFNSNKTYTWNFHLSATIEDTGDCPIRLCMYSTTVGALPVQCAVIDFKNKKYTMPSENICNGADFGPNSSLGKMLCHTHVGLIERVRFSEPMMVAPPLPPPEGATDASAKYLIKDQCDGKFIDDKKTIFQYVMPENECYQIFDTVAKPHRRSKLTAIPYDLPQYSGGN